MPRAGLAGGVAGESTGAVRARLAVQGGVAGEDMAVNVVPVDNGGLAIRLGAGNHAESFQFRLPC